MSKFYKAILNGSMTLEQVPSEFKEQVEAKLNEGE